MGLQDTYRKLIASQAASSLVLNKKTLEVEHIEDIFMQAFGEAELSLSDVSNLDFAQQLIVITGKTSLYNIEELLIDASIFETAGKQQIVVSADLLSNWAYSPGTPSLPPNVETLPELNDELLLAAIHQQLAAEKPRLVFSSIAHHSADINVHLEQGANLVWTMTPSSTGVPVSLAGPVTLKDGRLHFSYALPHHASVGPSKLDNIELLSVIELGDAFVPSRYGMKGRLTVGSLPIEIQGAIDHYNHDIELLAETQNLALPGFQVLQGLLGVSDANEQLSADLKSLPNLKLTRAAVRFNPVRASVARAAVTVETSKSWRVLAPDFIVDKLSLDIDVNSPFDSGSRFISGRVTGKMSVAGVNLTVRSFFPNPIVIGDLDKGQQVTLKKLLGQYLPAVRSVPALKLSQLSALVDPLNQKFVLSAGVEGDWTLDLGVTRVTATNLLCDVMSDAGRQSGALRGQFRMAGAGFLLSATMPEIEFSADQMEADEISLKAVLMELTAGAVTLPASLPDVMVLNTAMQASAKTGSFSLSTACHTPLVLSLGSTTASLNYAAWRLAGKKGARGKTDWMASVAGAFSIGNFDFDVAVSKDAAAADAWTLAGSLSQEKPLKLQDVLKAVLPASASVLPIVADLMIDHLSVRLDLATSAFALEAKTATSVSLSGIGSVEVQGLSIQVGSRNGSASQNDWRIKLIGGLKMGTGYRLAGSLDCFDDATGTGLAFVPTGQTPFILPLPVPAFNNKSASAEIAFGVMSISEVGGEFTFKSSVTVGLKNLPELFDRIITDSSVGSLELSRDGIALTVDRLIEGIEVELPKITASATQQVDLGKVRFDITNLQLAVGADATFSAMLGIGIPEKLNNLFGVKANGKPQLELFRTYDPRKPQDSLTRCLLSAGPAGVSLTLVDSPLKAIVFSQSAGKTWCECDFGDLGAVKFMLPVLSLDTTTSSFKGAGAMEVTRPLRIPLALIKNMLAANDQQQFSNLLPESVPLNSVKLLDAQNNIDVDKMAAHLELSSRGAVRLPTALKDTFKLFSGVFNKLPDRFRQYFDISLPDGFDFDISVTPDGGVTVNVSVAGAPIKALFCNPPYPMLFGIELSGLSFGEILAGNLFLLKADAKVDMFDPFALAASLLPDVPFLANSHALQQTFIIEKLTMLIVYQTAIPIPIPVFYDELGYEYHGIEDMTVQTHVKFPMPTLNPMEIVALFGQFQKFAADKNYMMDTRNPPRDTDLKFTLGANFIQLPKYLGSAVLGKKTDLASISLYQTVAGLMNGIKSFSLNQLIQIVPEQHRVGSQSIAFLGMTFSSQWLVTTPQEFVEGAYRKLDLNVAAKQELLALVPRAPSNAAGSDGVVVFLQGSGSVAGLAGWHARFALAMLEDVGCTTGFRMAGNLVDGLVGIELSGAVKLNGRSATPFELKGTGGITFLGEKAMNIEVGYDSRGMTLKGFLDLFPTTSLLQLEGHVLGTIDKDSFLLEGDVRYSLGQHFVLNGARARMTERELAVAGSWMGQSIELSMTRQGNGVRFASGISPLVAAGNALRITGPSSMGGPNVAISARQGAVPECTLTGAVELLGLSSLSQISLTPLGSKFRMTGQVFSRFHATLDVATSIDLLRADAVHINATLEADFFGAVKAVVTSGLRNLAQEAEARVNAVKAKLDEAKRDLDGVIEQLDAMTRQIQAELRVRENQARAEITSMQKRVAEAQRAVSTVRGQVNRDKARAERALNDAQEQVDNLKREIDGIKDDLKTWNRRLKNCKPWEVDKIADLGLKIADGEIKKAGLETAKTAASAALSAAQAALDLATDAANSALAGVNQQLAAANRSLDDANRRMADVQRQIQKVGDDIRLTSFKAARDTKNAVFNQSKIALDRARQSEKALLDIGTAIANTTLSTQVFEVTSAVFSGFLNALQGGRVTLVIAIKMMARPPRTLTLPFDFNNPAAGMAAIFTEVQELI